MAEMDRSSGYPVWGAKAHSDPDGGSRQVHEVPIGPSMKDCPGSGHPDANDSPKNNILTSLIDLISLILGKEEEIINISFHGIPNVTCLS